MSPSCPTCHHLHPTGKRCGSPALRGEQFCFYHHPTRRPPIRAAARTPFDVPPITDPENLQITLSEIIRRLADNTLDTKRAGLLLATLQMAKSNLPAFSHLQGQYASPHTGPSQDFGDLPELLSIPGLHPTQSASIP